MTIEIIPTWVPKSADDLAEGARMIRPFAPVIHIDIDDGAFAPVITWPYTKKAEFSMFDLSAATGLVAEIHLMVEDPRIIGAEFARAGAHRIIGHVEAFATTEEAHGALDLWRESGAREVGLGALLQTPLEVLEPLVETCDVVHLMSIATIGTQGIPYDQSAPARIAEFHARYPDIVISVDGGVSEKNIQELVRAGATRFGVGSALSKVLDKQTAYLQLKSLAEEAAV